MMYMNVKNNLLKIEIEIKKKFLQVIFNLLYKKFLHFK
jgi:hypothetical protein